MMRGQLTEVNRVPSGCEVAAPVAEGATVVPTMMALDVPEIGGVTLDLPDGTTVAVASADHETDVVTLADPLPVALVENDWLSITDAQKVVAKVEMPGGPVSVPVPQHLQSLLPDRFEEIDAGVTVLMEMDSGGALSVTNIVGSRPVETWGDPAGQGMDIGEGGIVVRDTIIADSIATNGDIRVAGIPLAGRMLEGGDDEVGWLERAGVGIVAMRNFTDVTPARPAGEEWGYAALSATCRGGRLYRVSVTASVRPGVTNAGAVVRLRGAASGTAGTSSPQLARGDVYSVTGPTHTPRVFAQGFVEYAADTDVDVLVTYQGAGGATPAMFGAEIAFEDVGPQGDYGGGSYRHLAPGGTADPTPPPPPTAPVAREYTSTWMATMTGTYRGNGTRRTDVTDLVQGYLAQGHANGHNQGLILFGATGAITGEKSRSLNQALTGATVKKVELWLYADHWYQSVGGTARLGKWSSSDSNPSLPSTLNATATMQIPQSSARWKVNQGRWVTVPNSWISDGTRGITLGGGSSRSAEYYGRFAGVHSSTPQARRPRIRVTYTR